MSEKHEAFLRELDEEKREIKTKLEENTRFKRVLNLFDEKIHPAGCVQKVVDGDETHTLVIEPIASNEYVYNINGKKRGKTHIVPNTKTNLTYMNIEGRDFMLEGKPLDDGMFKIINHPRKEDVLKWLKGKRATKTSNELFGLVKNYFKIFLDLSEDCYYDLLTMTVFQSWLQELLESVWYVSITGEFGGGKTTTMEACAKLCKHGCTPGDASVSFISRGIDMLKMVPFLDEFDSIAGELDSEHYAIVRMGQRRGQPFSRMGDKGGTFQTFDVFGTKLISVHGQLEDALQSRSLIINTCESEDHRVPHVARAMTKMSTALYSELWLWYLSNIHSITIVDVVDVVDYISNTNISSVRDSLFSMFHPPVNRQPGQLKGRDAEIQGSWLTITRFLGFDEKVNHSVNRLIELKAEIREEMRETGVTGLLREFLIRTYKNYRENSEYWNSEGHFMYGHKNVHEEFKTYAKSKGEFPTKGVITGALKELGFVSGVNGNKKKMKVWDEGDKKRHTRLALIYDERVQRRLGIKILNENEHQGLLNNVSDEVNNV